MAKSETTSFAIDTEVTPAYYEKLLDYTYQNYMQPQTERISNVMRSAQDGKPVLSFTFSDPENKWNVDIELKTGKPVQISMTPSVDAPQTALDRLKEDLIIILQYFEEQIRRSTLYFAWVQGRPVVPEKSPFRRARILERILFGNILILYVLFFAISIVVVLGFTYIFSNELIGLELASIFIVASQLLTVIFADRIVGTLSDWPISAKNPTVHILQYHLPDQERATFTQKYSREKLLQMKKEIYDQTIARDKPIECATAHDVMTKYGLECSPENMSTKAINVHEIVQKTTEKFGLPVPKINLANTMVPNAAATGLSPKRGAVLITTGLLVQLEDDEITSVLGHELSHLNARDPFVLFGLVSAELLFRIFVLLPYIENFLFLYLIFILWLIYFIAKFFEARADLDSAMKIGNPKILAGALTKIGYRRLQFERSPSARVSDWITWDPHPPIYFRVQRLQKLDENKPIKHTFIQSAKDCIRGFVAAF